MTASQTLAKQKQLVTASIIGLLSGMAPDLDVMIRSESDPLLFLEFHRQFTHSLFFIPIGGLLCALVFSALMSLFQKSPSLTFKQTYLIATLGYATHGLLDTFTSYGTQLLWPFSIERIAWNSISIIDPLFTIPLLAIAFTVMVKRSKGVVLIAVMYGLSYLSLGMIQHNRAYDAALQLATHRGHNAINISVKPSFGNLIVWKSIYQYQSDYYVDGIHVLQQPKYFPGTVTPKLDINTDLPWLDLTSQQAKDIERFRWFSSDHLSLDPNNPYRIIDMRYSMLPNNSEGLWGIVLSPDADNDQHIQWTSNGMSSERRQNLTILWSMIKGHNSVQLADITPPAQ